MRGLSCPSARQSARGSVTRRKPWGTVWCLIRLRKGRHAAGDALFPSSFLHREKQSSCDSPETPPWTEMPQPLILEAQRQPLAVWAQVLLGELRRVSTERRPDSPATEGRVQEAGWGRAVLRPRHTLPPAWFTPPPPTAWFRYCAPWLISSMAFLPETPRTSRRPEAPDRGGQIWAGTRGPWGPSFPILPQNAACSDAQEPRPP